MGDAGNVVMAEMKAKASEQTTQTLCEALVLLAALPGSDAGRMARAVTLDVLCERHSEARASRRSVGRRVRAVRYGQP